MVSCFLQLGTRHQPPPLPNGINRKEKWSFWCFFPSYNVVGPSTPHQCLTVLTVFSGSLGWWWSPKLTPAKVHTVFCFFVRHSSIVIHNVHVIYTGVLLTMLISLSLLLVFFGDFPGVYVLCFLIFVSILPLSLFWPSITIDPPLHRHYLYAYTIGIC